MPSTWYSRSQNRALAIEEVAHLVAPVVEDERAPVGVLAAARVGVLVERGAVEARERELVAREVRGHPVEDHAEAVAVQAVDELAEVVGRAEARRRRVVAGHLVAPRAAERVRHHGHQLEVGEAHVLGVGGELVGELEVGQRAVVLERVQPPRAEVDLVDRSSAPRAACSCAAPPSSPRRARRARARCTTEAVLGGSSASNAYGSAFSTTPPSGAGDLVLVGRAGADAGEEQLPDPARAERRASGAGARPRS